MLERFSPDITRGDAKVAGALDPKNVKKDVFYRAKLSVVF
jgi:hypothetical protein